MTNQAPPHSPGVVYSSVPSAEFSGYTVTLDFSSCAQPLPLQHLVHPYDIELMGWACSRVHLATCTELLESRKGTDVSELSTYQVPWEELSCHTSLLSSLGPAMFFPFSVMETEVQSGDPGHQRVGVGSRNGEG